MKNVFTIALIIYCGCAMAQMPNFIMRADSLIGKFYYQSGFDTAYVSRPSHRFLTALHPDFSAIGISLSKAGRKAGFTTDLSDRIGAFVTYRGYGVGYSVRSPWGRTSNDKEFNFKFFCRRWGVETDFCRASTFSADITDVDSSYSIERGDIDFKMRMFSFYYVFNNKKFAFPAAFDKSYTQLKSCGSILLGGAYLVAKMNTVAGDIDVKSQSSGIGCGYGYNFVTKKKVLFHISLIPSFVFWEKNRMRTSNEEQTMKYKVTDIGLYARTAMTYNFHRCFIGADLMIYTTMLGDMKGVSASFARQISRVFFGVWFW